MNRAERRARQREARTKMRAEGCTCRPAMNPIERHRVIERGAVDGYYVLHEQECPVGNAIYRLNVAGIVPNVWSTTSVGRCGR
jgi:hypothetical protein